MTDSPSIPVPPPESDQSGRGSKGTGRYRGSYGLSKPVTKPKGPLNACDLTLERCGDDPIDVKKPNIRPSPVDSQVNQRFSPVSPRNRGVFCGAKGSRHTWGGGGGGGWGVNPRNPTKTVLKVTPTLMGVDFAIIFILPLFLGTETVLPPYTALL